MIKKKIITNIFWYGVIPRISVLFSLISLPIITPYLTAFDYGIWGLISSYIAIAASFCTAGLHIHIANYFFEKPDSYKIYWRYIYFIMLTISVIVFCILYFILLAVLPNEIEYKKAVVFLSLLPLIFIPNKTIVENYFVLNDVPKFHVLGNLFVNLSYIVLLVVLVRFFNLGYLAWVLCATFSSLLAYIFFFKKIRLKEKIYPKKSFVDINLRKIILLSIPVIPHSLGHVLLSSSDRIVMHYYNVSTIDIGLYSNAYQIAQYLNLILVAFGTAISSILQRAYREKQYQETNYLFRVGYYFTFICLGIFVVWMPEFYKLLIRNETLQVANMTSSLIALSYFPTVFYIFVSAYIFIEKETPKLLYLVFLPGILNIILNCFLVPYYGYVGAVVSTIISYWVIFLLPFTSGFFKKIVFEMIDHKANLKNLCLLFISGVLFSVAAIFVRDISILYKFFFSLFLLITFAVIFKNDNYAVVN